MLDAVRVIADPERFGRDVLLHCPEHATDAPWVAEVRAAWAWADMKHPLAEWVAHPTAALIDGVLLLACEVAARDRADRPDPGAT